MRVADVVATPSLRGFRAVGAASTPDVDDDAAGSAGVEAERGGERGSPPAAAGRDALAGQQERGDALPERGRPPQACGWWYTRTPPPGRGPATAASRSPPPAAVPGADRRKHALSGRRWHVFAAALTRSVAHPVPASRLAAAASLPLGAAWLAAPRRRRHRRGRGLRRPRRRSPVRF